MTDNIKKFRLTDEYIEHEGDILYRIEALVDIDNFFEEVRKGDLGGFLESEDNLDVDIDDRSWVDKDSLVKSSARVSGHSNVRGSVIKGDSVLMDGSVAFYGSVIDNTGLINGSRVFGSNVYKSELDNSSIDHSDINNSIITDSIVYDGSKADNSVVINYIGELIRLKNAYISRR